MATDKKQQGRIPIGHDTKDRTRFHVNLDIPLEMQEQFFAFCKDEDRPYAEAARYFLKLGMLAFYEHKLTIAHARPPRTKKPPTPSE